MGPDIGQAIAASFMKALVLAFVVGIAVCATLFLGIPWLWSHFTLSFH